LEFFLEAIDELVNFIRAVGNGTGAISDRLSENRKITFNHIIALSDDMDEGQFYIE